MRAGLSRWRGQLATLRQRIARLTTSPRSRCSDARRARAARRARVRERTDSMKVFWVAFGGAIGSACRYLLDGAVYRVLPATFPYGTFVVNVIGCLVFGY